MKKLLSVTICFIMLMLAFSVSVSAADDLDPVVYVTISAGKGEIELASSPVFLTDTDGDGLLTIRDALYGAHEIYHENGISAFGSEVTSYGLSLTKLWGDESGAYGYTVNNRSAMSLSDTVKENDKIYAYVYSDKEFYSDCYSFFDKTNATLDKDETLDLTLQYQSYAEDFSVVTNPLANAVITVDGERTEFVTDENGKVTVSGLEKGWHLISAESDSLVLVPPVMSATVEGGNIGTILLYSAIGVLAVLAVGVIIVIIKKKKNG